MVARWPGSTHDSFVFRSSEISDYLQQHNRSLEDGILLGDSGYACKPNLMTPFPNPVTAKQHAFNSAHRKTRVLIKLTFSRWKRRFHLLHGEVRMHPEKVCKLIGACGVLHNIAIIHNEPMEDGDDEENEIPPYEGPEEGRLVRDHIANEFF